MEKRVTIQPSGHSFQVLADDSILQSGLKAGLAMPYGCSNGTCGLCRARLVSGDVTPIGHSDHRFSAAEKAQGLLLTCINTAASSETELEVVEAESTDEISHQEITVRVSGVETAGEDLLILRLKTPRNQRFRFLAGQSAELGVPGNGRVSCILPVASCPCDDRNLEFHVHRQANDGLFDSLVEAGARPGKLDLAGPTGDFVLGGARDRHFVFMAEDTGFAPVRSLIEHVISLDEDARISLCWLATRPAGHYMENLCRSWSDALDNFRHSLLQSPDECRMEKILGSNREDIEETEVFVAGSEAFVDRLGPAFKEAGIATDRLHLACV